MRGSKARGVPFNPSSVIAVTMSAASASISACASSRHAIAEHRLRAVQQRNSFLRIEFDRGDPGAAQRFPARHTHAAIFRLAFAHQHQRHVRQRSQIAARADAASRRDDRRHARVQQIAHALRHDAADSRKIPWRARWRGSASSRGLRWCAAGRRRRPHVTARRFFEEPPDRKRERARRPAARRRYSPHRPERRRRPVSPPLPAIAPSLQLPRARLPPFHHGAPPRTLVRSSDRCHLAKPSPLL